MKKRICSQCAYGVGEPAFWMHQLLHGWPATLMCANCAESPGRLRAVCPGGSCRNFVPRHDPSYRLPEPEPQSGDIRFISLTQGKFAIVDAADYEWLSKYNWLAMTSYNTTYAFRKENGKVILMHREIMKPRKGQVVDHINRNGADNRRSNLRNCSNRQNVCNAGPRGGTSQYRGVCRHGTKWSADIGHLSVRVHIGLFVEEIEAARAHDRKAIELHGQYAYLNLPDEWTAEQREALYNSPEAIQARADAKKRSAKLLRARRKPAHANPQSAIRNPQSGSAEEGRKVRSQEGKTGTRNDHKSQPRPDAKPRRKKSKRPRRGARRTGAKPNSRSSRKGRKDRKA